MKTTDFIVEYAGIGNDAEAMGQDHEVQLARQDLYNTAKNAIELHARLKSISEETGLEGWVSEKITLAADYLATVNNYFAEQDQPDMDMLDSFSFESAEQQYDQLVNESEDHPDEEEDKKLIKKMVKPAALKDGKVDEAFPHDVDHMPGQTVKNPMSGCKRCHGYGKIWKSPDGKVLSGNNAPGAKQYKCGACKGVGFVKEEGVTETSKAKIDRYTRAASDAHGHADFMSRAAGPGQEKFAQDQRKIADKRAAGLRRAAERGEKSDVEENKDNEPFNYEEWKASSVKPRKPRGYKDAEALGQQQREIDRKKKDKVDEADKHSIVGKIQRGHELKKKVDSTWTDLSAAQQAGDGSAASRAFKKHERYANLERPGTWTKVKEESGQQDMTGQTCEKCKKGTYQERSQHDDMEGKVSCSCGNRVDRWKNYQAEGVADVVKGIKRKVAGKQDPAEVQYQHGFRARQAIDASRKFNNQAAYDNEKKMVDRYNRVHKVVNKEGVAEAARKERLTPISQEEQRLEIKVKDALKAKNIDEASRLASSAERKVVQKYLDNMIRAALMPTSYWGQYYAGQSPQGVEEGYTVTRGIDRERYQERAGLEGPFATKIGRVVYYDPREGKYYDPDTDMYIEYDDWRAMNEASDPSGIFTAAQHNHAFIVSAEVDGKRKKFRVYHQNAELAKKKFLQHHSMATVLDVKPEAAKGVTEESDDDSFNAAYVAGLRHGSAGVGNNMDRAKKEWGSSFADYNRGFLKGRNSKAKSLKATGQGYGKKQQVAELDASTMQAYLNKRKETATPASAHQAVKQAQGVRSAKEKIADKEIEARARRTGRVSESAGEPNTDQILEYLTSGYLMLRDNRNMFTEEGFATIERIYNGLRYDLKDGNYAGFMRSYGEYMSKYPDASVELIDAMFEAAGLESEKGTIEQFLALCSESVAARPVTESASAGGTSAGAIATGVAGAAAGKPGTGKPKKVSNVIKRNKPAFGKGVY